MILARGQAAPLRFLLLVVLVWIAGRGVLVAGWRPGADATAPGMVSQRHPDADRRDDGPTTAAVSAAMIVRDAVDAMRGNTRLVGRETARWRPALTIALLDPRSAVPARAIVATGTGSPDASPPRRLALASAATARSYARSTGAASVAALVGDPMLARTPLPRVSGSAWAFVRGGGHARPLSPDGQIGAGQTGARILYRLDERGRLAAAARLSGTIGGPRQTEAALGLDWRPLAAVPVHLMAERRFAIDRGGRDAWTLGAAGGVYAVPIAPGWRLDGYGEAGVVGAHRRDLYADGAVRAGRELDLGLGRSLTLGAGAWGAAQPHAARLDAGPTAVLRLPIERRTVALALDYRRRIAGRARPHSGVALTAGVDF